MIGLFQPVYELPAKYQDAYLNSVYRMKYFESRMDEWVEWPSSAQVSCVCPLLSVVLFNGGDNQCRLSTVECIAQETASPTHPPRPLWTPET